MTDFDDPDARGPDLPPELDELHRSLSRLRIEERASFGPELEAELEKAWLSRPRRPAARGRFGAWWTVAAAAVVLLTLTVPPARAALARFLDGVVEVVGEEEVEAPVEETRVPVAEPVPVNLSEGGRPLPAPTGPDETELRLDLPTLAGGPDEITGGESEAAGRNALPGLADRAAAEELIRRAYPEDLQRRGVGGIVRLLLYVEPNGSPDHIRVRRSSGVDALDRAAVAAARSFSFTPAVHGDVPVGQWVEFNVRFRVPRRDPSLSDLYLVSAGISPDEAPELGLVEPRLVRNVWRTPGRGEMGVFFQLHDLPAGRHDYEVRAVLEPVRGGLRTRLRLHPQDEGPFRPAWTRVAVGPGTVQDYLIVDLGGVERGEYVLRIEAVLSDSERIVESTRRLRVR